MTETELYLLYREGFEKVLSILLQKQNKGKYAEREKAILADINKILREIEVETDNFSRNKIAETYQASRADVFGALAINAPKTLAGVDKRAIRELKNIFDNQIYDGISQVKRNINKTVQKIAIAQKISGGKTREKVSEAVKILNSQNIFTFEDKLGRSYNLASYAEMAIKTIQTSAVNKAIFTACDTIDNDLVKMSSHITSCPLCAMYQGRIYSISGKDKRYPPLSTINNGAVVQYSILHPRCKHRFTAYIEEFDDDVEENRKLSNQPFIDNRTEEQKKKYLVKQQMNAYRNRKVKLNEKIEIYNKFENELTQEQLFEKKKLENSRKLINKKLRDIKNWEIDTTPATKKIEVVKNTSGELYTKFGEKHYDNIQKIVNESDDLEKQLWIKAEDRLQIADAKSRKKGAYYTRLEGVTVNIEKNSLKSEYGKPYQTIFHEFGHNMDYLANENKSAFSIDYKDGIFEKTIKKEFADKLTKYKEDMEKHFKIYEKDFDKLYELNYITKNQAEYLKEGYGKISELFNSNMLFRKISKDIYDIGKGASSRLSDIVEGASGGRINAGFGHGAAYWRESGRLSLEAFAEMFETSITKNTEQLEAIKSFFPESYEIYKQMVKEMTDKL